MWSSDEFLMIYFVLIINFRHIDYCPDRQKSFKRAAGRNVLKQ